MHRFLYSSTAFYCPFLIIHIICCNLSFAYTALILEPEKDTVAGRKNVTFIVAD